jgi:hypothetical protein
MASKKTIRLRNYTTEVPASRSIENIEKLLVAAGASNIMKGYESGNCISISFILTVNSMKVPFQLPAKVQKVYMWLKKEYPTRKQPVLQAQAERIAWKLQHEWLHLQLSLNEIDQAELLELLLPYVYDVQRNETFYSKIKSGGYKAMLPEQTT